MTTNQSPHSPGRVLNKIALPERLIIHHKKRGKFIRELPGYEQIEGKSPKIPDEIMDQYTGEIPIVETYPVINNDSECKERAMNNTRELASQFYHVGKRKVKVDSRTYMLSGYTKPIRVDLSIEDDKAVKKREMFVKRPSVERIVGLRLYNLLSINNSVDFAFNEYVFVEDKVSGSHPNDDTLALIGGCNPNFPYSIVRLSVIDKFLGITDLERSKDWRGGASNSLVNLIVQRDASLVAFDVDCIFDKIFPDYDLVNLFRKKGVEISEDLEDEVSKNEKNRILSVIHSRSKKVYGRLLRMIGRIPYLTQKFQNLGFDSVKDYFNFKENWLKE
jgi:hypothetical protein